MDNYINLTHESRKVVRAEQFLSMRNREGVYRVFWTGCPLTITAYTTNDIIHLSSLYNTEGVYFHVCNMPKCKRSVSYTQSSWYG